jgi:hypothetical protein
MNAFQNPSSAVRDAVATAPQPLRRRATLLAGCALAAGLGLALPVATAGSASATAGTTTPAYAISVSTHTLAFGPRNTGSVTTKSVKVVNVGTQALDPLRLRSGSSQFRVRADSCSGRSLAPAASCSYSVAFAPTLAGSVSGRLKVLTDQGTPAQNVALTGTGVQQMMQSYFYQYTYASPPVINGVAAPQSFIGSGWAPTGTYAPGQVIAVYDPTGLTQIGSYRIGATSAVSLDPTRLGHVAVSSYTWGTKTITATGGLQSVDGVSGLGSEAGYLNGYGAEGTSAHFDDHNAAIRPSHW